METLLKNAFIPNWMAGLLLLSFILMVITKQRYTYRFQLFLGLLTNAKYVLVFNKKKANSHPFQIIWQFFAILNTSLFIYLYLEKLSVWIDFSYLNQLNFVNIVLLVGGLVFLKQSAQIIHGLFFNNQRIMKELLFKKTSYFNYASVVFFVANLLKIFIFPEANSLFFIAISLVFLITLGGWILILRNHQKYILSNFFYFILYLCALEIAPFLIFGSLLKD